MKDLFHLVGAVIGLSAVAHFLYYTYLFINGGRITLIEPNLYIAWAEFGVAIVGLIGLGAYVVDFLFSKLPKPPRKPVRILTTQERLDLLGETVN